MASLTLPDRPLRIAFLDSWLQQSSEGSGTAVSIGGLGRALLRHGHQVVRISPWFNWPEALILRRLLFNVQIPALLQTQAYDVIVGFDIDGFLWSRRIHTSLYICNVKGVLADESRFERGTPRYLLGSLSMLERINARHAALVLTDSRYCSSRVQHYYGVPESRIRLVPAGIDLDRWQRRLEQINAAREPATILCVARQYPRKRIADLLHAFVRVQQQIPQARLIIIGDGPEHAALRALAHSLHIDQGVQFLGSVPDDNEVAAWFCRATIFCLPSIQECLGVVFLEAMASSLPIVSTTAAAMPEVIPQRRAGILVPPASPVALADALIELLEQPDLCTSYGAYGRSYVQQFDWERIVARFLHIVTEYLVLFS